MTERMSKVQPAAYATFELVFQYELCFDLNRPLHEELQHFYIPRQRLFLVDFR